MMDQNFLSLMLSQVVQVTILAIAVWWGTRCFAKDRPHLAHALWLLVLLKCLTPPVCHNPVSPFCWQWSAGEAKVLVSASDRPLPIVKADVSKHDSRVLDPVVIQANRENDRKRLSATPLPRTDAADQQAQPRVASTESARFQSDLWLIGFWLAGVAIIAAIALLRSVLFLRWLRSLPRRKHESLSDQLDGLARKLGVKRKVRLEVVDGPVGPAVFGFWRPRIVLPQAIVENQSLSQLEPLLAHELIHLRRGDLCWSALQLLATCAFWFHPLVWLASKKVSRESERSCDEETVASLGCCPSEYATCLLDVLEKKQRLRSAPVVPGIRQVDITSARLERVMTFGNGIRKTTPMWIRLAFVVLAAVVLPGAAAAVQLGATEDSTEAEAPGVTTRGDAPRETREYDISEMLKHLEPADLEVSKSEFLEIWLGYRQPVYQKVPLLSAGSTGHVRRPDGTLEPMEMPVTALEHAGWDVPKLYFDIKNQKLSAFTTEKIHQRIVKDIKHFSKFGFYQVVLETQVLSVDRETWASLGIPWETALSLTGKGNLEREMNKHNPAVVQGNAHSEPERLYSEDAHVRSKRYVQKNAPTLFSILDDQQVLELLKTVTADESASMDKRLRVITFNGRKASVSDQCMRPFVTSVMRTENNGKSEIQPVISIIPDGTHLTLTPVVGEDRKSIELNAEFELSQILSVDTFDIPRPEEGPISIQVPEVDITSVTTDIKLPDSKTLVLSLLREGDKEKAVQMVVLVTGRIVTPGQDQGLARSAAMKFSEVKPIDPSAVDAAIAAADSTAEETPPEKLKITTKDPQRMGDDYNQRLTDALLSTFNLELEIEGHLDYEIEDSKVVVRGNGIAFDIGNGNPSHADQGTVTFLKDNWLIDFQGNVRFNIGELKITCQHLKYGAAQLLTETVPLITAKGDASWEFGQTSFQADMILMGADGGTLKLFGNAKVVQKDQAELHAGQKIVVDCNEETIKVDDAPELPIPDGFFESEAVDDELVSGEEAVRDDEVRPVGYLEDAHFYFPDDRYSRPTSSEQAEN